MEHIGKTIILVGIVLILLGVALTLWDRIPLIGRLPGDIHFKRGNFQVYFPVVTFIILSVILTLVIALINHFWRR